MWLAYYVHHLNPFLIRFYDQFGIRWYGVAYLCGFIAAFYLLKWLARKGYGSLIEGQVADFTFISWTGIGDNLVAVAPIGLLFGRIANFINGELWGHPTNVPWAVQFPSELLDYPDKAQTAIDQCSALSPNLDSVNAIIDAARTNPQVREILSHILTPRHPSQLYEALLEGVILFVCLITIRLRFRKPDGLTTGCFFLLYPIMRIIGETFRVPDAPLTGPFTRGQFLSLFMFLIALGFFWRVWKTWPKEMTNDK